MYLGIFIIFIIFIMKFFNILLVFILFECGICYCQNSIKVNDNPEMETDWLDAIFGGIFWESMFQGKTSHFVIGWYPNKRGEFMPFRKSYNNKFVPLPNAIVLGTYHKDFDKDNFFQHLLPIWKANPMSNIMGSIETISEDSTRVWYGLYPIDVSDELHQRITSIRLAFGGLFWDSMFEIKGCEFTLCADGRIVNMILPPDTNTEYNRVIPNNALLLNIYNKHSDNQRFIEQMAAIWQFNKGKFINGFVEQIDEQNVKVWYGI